MTGLNIFSDSEMHIPPTPQKTGRQLNHPWLILALIALVALITEQIFFDQPDGMQWAIFVLMILLAILASVLIERLKVPAKSLWLILPILVLSSLHLFRSETFSLVAFVLATLACLVCLGTSFLNGQWAGYRLREHSTQTFMLFLNAVIGLPAMLIDNLRNGSASKSETQAGAETRKPIWAVLRGLLIALPILAIFSVLFASADAVFSNRVNSLFEWLGNFNIGRFLQETFLVAVITYITFGLFSFALTKTDQYQTLSPDKPMVKPFLGVTEANVVLGLVNLLFVLFLAIQFRYFFAGQVNISESGMTYSEYAVKGFQELIMVACISLGLHWLLAGITQRENPGQKTAFSILATLLIIQVGIILFSAFQRLSLYEAAYGFTQSRLVAHVFMVFVGLMLVAALWMQWRDAFRHQALVLLILFIVFAMTLGLINVDRTVVRRNLEKAASGGKLDTQFLANEVSADALPLMFDYYDQQLLTPELREKMGKVLACQANLFDESQPEATPWFAVSLPDRAAAKLFEQHAEALNTYAFEQKTWEDGLIQKGFTIDEVWVGCENNYYSND